MPLKVLVIDRAPPVSLRQGNALIGMEVFRRLADHHLTLVAPATAVEQQLARGLEGIFEAIHLVPRAARTPALAGSLEPALVRSPGSVPGLDLPAARALASEIRKVAGDGRFDVLHVRQLPMAGYGSMVRGAGRILELVDCETLGAERAQPRTWRTRLRAKLAASVERRSMSRYDIVTTVADADAARLRELNPAVRVEVVPNGVNGAHFHPTSSAVSSSTLVFVGVMSYPPNIAAMQYFTSQVLPLVRETRPDVRLIIVGRDPGPEVHALASLAVEVTGEVDDVRPYLGASAVFVAPMISGSGIKNKVLEAMAMARPVVATSLALEGLPIRRGESAVVADDEREFAGAIIRLLSDADERSRIGHAARSLVNAQFTWEACAARYRGLYQEVAELGSGSRGRDES